MLPLLFIDPVRNITLCWSDIIQKLNEEEFYSSFVYKHSYHEVFLQLIYSLILDEPITLLDSNFSKNELYELSITSDQINEQKILEKVYTKSFDDFLSSLNSLKRWSLTLFTSGTTGLPRKVTHSFDSITKGCKISNDFSNHIWGWAYNPTHMAGIQVFFQSILNKNLLVMLFNQPLEIVASSIENFNVTHLAGTPTFFRMSFPMNTNFLNVKSITFGGEKMDSNLLNKLKINFPNAQFRNVYASTEAGSLLSSEGEYFRINSRLKPFVKFVDNEIYLHKTLLGTSDSLQTEGEWYKTGDLVTFMDSERHLFKFALRKNEMINIGGYKVNPNEVEEFLNSHPDIILSRVFGKTNSVMGSIIVAEVISTRKTITEKELRDFLQNKIQPFKIPRIINFVDEIQLTRSGKKSIKS